MRYLRAGGFLALALMLVPLIWQGYEELDVLIDNPGGVCIIDGDLARSAAVAYPLDSEDARPSGNGVALGKGPAGGCELATANAAAYWQVGGAVYRTGHVDADVGLDTVPFPPAEWDWDLTLSWAPPLMTLEPYSWATRFLAPTMGLMPVASLACAIVLALRAYLGRDVMEEVDEDVEVEDYD